ncbi:type II 3-dehydroquinate dehydratase [Marinomonas sp. 2405UD68-3]|uniref:type II 3-dehydroquinate dehydratase n=1 Tax=Marinomonas sp. 2405UD68-3 TaxID=3391835 RepID=UPI0039C8D18D
MANFLVLNGPNLNLLGTREPEIYGHTTLDDIAESLSTNAVKKGHTVKFMQSNAEHILIDEIHSSRANTDYIIINPAAFTHTSIAIRDALLGVNIPFIEVHLSNIHAREPFRHHSYFSDVAKAVICGMGVLGYEYALDFAIQEYEKLVTH